MSGAVQVVAAIDDSAVSDVILERARGMVDDVAAELRVLTVVPPVLGHWATVESRVFSEHTPVQSIEKALAQDFRGRVLARVRAAGLPEDIFDVRFGRPDQQVLEAAKEYDAQLIIVGAHGKGLLERLVIGSTAEAVLHHADRNVLVVAPRS